MGAETKINFDAGGYTLRVDDKEETHEYSPFFPYDLIEIITKRIVESERYSWVKTYPSPDTLTSTALTNYSTSTASTTSGHNEGLYEELIRKLSPKFIEHGFKAWGYTSFLDQIIDLYKAHEGVFTHNQSTGISFNVGTDDNEEEEVVEGVEEDNKPHPPTAHTFFHKLHDLRPMFTQIKQIGLSSPIIFFLSLIHDDRNKKYFLDDLIKLSNVKFVYVMESLFESVFFNAVMVKQSGHIIFDYIKNVGIEKIRNKEMPDLFDEYTTIVKHLPKSLNKFPEELNTSCYIPTLLEYPKTKFQWLLTNWVFEQDTPKTKNQRAVDRATYDEGDLKLITKTYLPYIQASEKVHELYIEHMNRVNGNRWRITSPHPNDEYELSAMVRYIKDGRDIYNTYKDRLIDVDGRMLKLAPIKGSFLKQMKNSIFNHTLEQKMTLDDKLSVLQQQGNDEDMATPENVKLPNPLEEHRIKSKSDMIILGKALKHCIGSKIESNHLFFRFDTLCAEIDMEKKQIVCCLDKKNERNADAKAFEELIYEEFAKIGINLKSDVFSARIARDRDLVVNGENGRDVAIEVGEAIEFGEAGAGHVYHIGAAEDYYAYNNNIYFNNGTGINFYDNTMGEVHIRAEQLKLAILENEQEVDTIEHVRTYNTYDGVGTTSTSNGGLVIEGVH